MKMKSIITSAAVIAASALILFVSGMALSGSAAQNSEAEYEEMLLTLLPGSESLEWEAYEGEDESIEAVYKGENGFVIQTAAYGYAGNIRVMKGVSNDGKVTGLVVRDLSETWGLGANALTDTDFLTQFLGTSGEAEVGTNIDAMTGATVSSKAVTRAVNAAVAYVTGADTSSSATSWGG